MFQRISRVWQKAKKNSASRTAAAYYLSFASTAIWGFATIPVAIAYLNAEQLGLWMVVNAFLSYLLWMDFGVGAATGRLIAKPVADCDQLEINRWWTLTRVALVTLCFLLIVLGLTIRPLVLDLLSVSNKLRDEASFLITGGVILTGLSVPLRGVTGLMTAQDRFYWIPLIQSITPWIHFIIFYVMLSQGHGIKSYIYAMAAGQSATWLFYNILIVTGTPRPRLDISGLRFHRFKRLLNLSSNITIIGLVETVLNTIPAVIIARLGGYALVPIYNISRRAPLMVADLVNRTYQSFYPSLQYLYVTGKKEEFKKKHADVGGLVIGVSLCAAAAVLCGNQLIVQLIANQSFYVSPFANGWFAVAAITIPYTTLFRSVLVISGNYGKNAIISVLKLFIAVLCCYLLWPWFNLVGIAATLALVPLITCAYAYFRAPKNCGFKRFELSPKVAIYGLCSIMLVWVFGVMVGFSEQGQGFSFYIADKRMTLPTLTSIGISLIPAAAGIVIVSKSFRKLLLA